MASPKMVSLEYTFIFDSSANIWTNLFSFERDLADFFAANGLEAEIIPTIEGSSGKRMMMVKKLEEIQKLDNDQKRYRGGVNMPQQLSQGKAQKSYNTIKKLTDSIGGGKRA